MFGWTILLYGTPEQKNDYRRRRLSRQIEQARAELASPYIDQWWAKVVREEMEGRKVKLAALGPSPI